MAKFRKRPTLVALDFQQGRACRYVSKPTGGFFTEVARISDAEGEPTTVGFGGEAGLALIEEFRKGERPGQVVAIEQEVA